MAVFTGVWNPFPCQWALWALQEQFQVDGKVKWGAMCCAVNLRTVPEESIF